MCLAASVTVLVSASLISGGHYYTNSQTTPQPWIPSI